MKVADDCVPTPQICRVARADLVREPLVKIAGQRDDFSGCFPRVLQVVTVGVLEGTVDETFGRRGVTSERRREIARGDQQFLEREIAQLPRRRERYFPQALLKPHRITVCTDRRSQRCDEIHPHERVIAIIRIQLGMELVPVLLAQPLDQFQTVTQTGQAVLAHQRIGEQHRDTEIDRALEHRNAPILDLSPVRVLAVLDQLTIGRVLRRFTLRILKQRHELSVVLQVRPARLVRRDLAEQFLDIDQCHGCAPLSSPPKE